MDSGFDFVDGDLGYVIQRAPGVIDETSGLSYVDDNPMVQYNAANGNDLGYIIEVHYIGSPVTTVKLQVSNMMGDLGTSSSQVDYVGKAISPESTDDSGLEYKIIFDDNVDDTYGLNAWSMQAGGMDPAYGLISIPLSSDFISGVASGIGPDASKDAATGSDGSLNMQASLYYDIISPNQEMANASTSALLDVITLNGNTVAGSSNGGENPNIAADTAMNTLFASLQASPENQTVSLTNTDAIKTADDDMVEVAPGLEYMLVNEMPEFNISYISAAGHQVFIDYDFALASAGDGYYQNDGSLIGEFRIKPDASTDVDWSFDANFQLSVSTNYDVQNYADSGGSTTDNRETLAGHIPTLEYGMAVDQSINISMANGKIAFASDDTDTDDTDTTITSSPVFFLGPDYVPLMDSSGGAIGNNTEGYYVVHAEPEAGDALLQEVELVDNVWVEKDEPQILSDANAQFILTGNFEHTLSDAPAVFTPSQVDGGDTDDTDTGGDKSSHSDPFIYTSFTPTGFSVEGNEISTMETFTLTAEETAAGPENFQASPGTGTMVAGFHLINADTNLPVGPLMDSSGAMITDPGYLADATMADLFTYDPSTDTTTAVDPNATYAGQHIDDTDTGDTDTDDTDTDDTDTDDTDTTITSSPVFFLGPDYVPLMDSSGGAIGNNTEGYYVVHAEPEAGDALLQEVELVDNVWVEKDEPQILSDANAQFILTGNFEHTLSDAPAVFTPSQVDGGDTDDTDTGGDKSSHSDPFIYTSFTPTGFSVEGNEISTMETFTLTAEETAAGPENFQASPGTGTMVAGFHLINADTNLPVGPLMDSSGAMITDPGYLADATMADLFTYDPSTDTTTAVDPNATYAGQHIDDTDTGDTDTDDTDTDDTDTDDTDTTITSSPVFFLGPDYVPLMDSSGGAIGNNTEGYYVVHAEPEAGDALLQEVELVDNVWVEKDEPQILSDANAQFILTGNFEHTLSDAPAVFTPSQVDGGDTDDTDTGGDKSSHSDPFIYTSFTPTGFSVEGNEISTMETFTLTAEETAAGPENFQASPGTGTMVAGFHLINADTNLPVGPLMDSSGAMITDPGYLADATMADLFTYDPSTDTTTAVDPNATYAGQHIDDTDTGDTDTDDTDTDDTDTDDTDTTITSSPVFFLGPDYVPLMDSSGGAIGNNTEGYYVVHAEPEAGDALLQEVELVDNVWVEKDEPQILSDANAQFILTGNFEHTLSDAPAVFTPSQVDGGDTDDTDTGGDKSSHSDPFIYTSFTPTGFSVEGNEISTMETFTLTAEETAAGPENFQASPGTGTMVAGFHLINADTNLPVGPLMDSSGAMITDPGYLADATMADLFTYDPSTDTTTAVDPNATYAGQHIDDTDTGDTDTDDTDTDDTDTDDTDTTITSSPVFFLGPDYVPLMDSSGGAIGNNTEGYYVVHAEPEAGDALLQEVELVDNVWVEKDEPQILSDANAQFILTGNFEHTLSDAPAVFTPSPVDGGGETGGDAGIMPAMESIIQLVSYDENSDLGVVGIQSGTYQIYEDAGFTYLHKLVLDNSTSGNTNDYMLDPNTTPIGVDTNRAGEIANANGINNNVVMNGAVMSSVTDSDGDGDGGDKSSHSDPFIYTSFTPTGFSVEGNEISTMETFTLTAEETAAGPENFQASPGTGTMVAGFHLINADTNLPVGPLMDSSGAMITDPGYLADATMADLFTYDPSTDTTTAVDPNATYQDQHTDGDDHVDDGNTGGDNGGGDMTTYEPANLQVDGVNIYTEWMNGASNDSAGYFIKDGNTTDMYGPLEDETGTLYSSTTIQGSSINEWNTDEGNIVDDYGLGGLEGIVNYGGGGLIGTVYPADDGSYIMVRNNEDGSGLIQAFNSSGTSMHDTLTSVTDGVMFVSSGIERFEDGSYSITMNSADSVRIQEFNSSYQMVNRTITNTDGSGSEREYNDAGDMTKQTITNTDGSTSETEYNGAGNITKQTNTATDGAVYVTEYSASGILSTLTQTDIDGAVYVTEYSASGILSTFTHTDIDGNISEREYNDAGDMTKQTITNTDGSTSEREYNDAGDMTKQTNTATDGSTSEIEYGGSDGSNYGLITKTTSTDIDGNISEREYNDAGDMTKQTFTEHDGAVYVTEYSAPGILSNRTTTTETDGSVIVSEYNDNGDLAKETITSATDGDGSYTITINSPNLNVGRFITQEFNTSDTMLKETSTNADGVFYVDEYNDAGNIMKKTSTYSPGEVNEQIEVEEYNNEGIMTKFTVTTANQVEVTDYNEAGNTIKVTHTSSDGFVSVIEFNDAGSIKTETNSDGSYTVTTDTAALSIKAEYSSSDTMLKETITSATEDDGTYNTTINYSDGSSLWTEYGGLLVMRETNTNPDFSYDITTYNQDNSSSNLEYNVAGDLISETNTATDGSYTITSTNEDGSVSLKVHNDVGVMTSETTTESNGYYAITTYQDGSILDVKNYDNLDNEITQQYYVPDEAVTSGQEIVTHIKTFFDESDNSLTSHAPETVSMGSGNISINYNNAELNGTIINVLSTDSNGQVWSENLTLTNTGSRAIWGQGNAGNVDGTKYLDAALPLTMVITNSADGSGMGVVEVTGTSLGTNEGAAGTNGTYDGSTLDAQFSITASNPDGIETLKGGQGSEGDDVFIGGIGSYVAEGGDGFDMFISATADLENIGDIDGNIINQNGVIIDLSASRVTYLGSNAADTVSNTEWFLGTQADDIFVGASRYESQYNIQAFNPSGGTDEIFGAEDTTDPYTGAEIKIITVADYSVMQSGQGVVFILSDGTNNDVAYSTQDGVNISDEAEGYWNNWLPSDDTIIDEQGFISSKSKYDTEKEGATVILDSFGDKDLAFNVDHYIGSDEADLFFGSNENDIFDAGTGTNNFMSGGAGQDELIISQDQFASDNIDQSTLTVSRSIRNDLEVVNINGSEIVSDASTPVSTGTYYRIDFADVSNISNFIGDNLSGSVSGKYDVSTEYALYLVSNDDLSGLSSSAFAYDALNGEIDVYGTDLSGLSGLTGNFILADETVVEGRFIIEGKTVNGDDYSTIIQDVEKVTITSDDVEYIGNDQLSVGDDSYELLIGGQGDLGDMLYVATGESLDSTTGVGAYTVNANFITGEIYYSGRHEDFERSIDLKTDGNAWATSVAAAYTTIDGIEQAKIWNDETAEFFVWYDSDGAAGSNEGYEIAVQYQNGDVNSWGIDNRNFDTFQNVQVDQALADAIKLQFGEGLDVEIGSYRVKYEAAFSDIETIISSNGDAKNWNFDFGADSSRSTFYIQVGADTTGENGNGGAADNKLTNVKVERVVDEAGGYKWSINPQAEILVNMPTVAGASQAADVMISGDAAETIEAGRGSDVMMGRGGSDNYKINIGDTLQTNDLGDIIAGDYGVAGDVINEIGGSSDDKADAITLASVTSIDQLIFTRTEIKNEEWSNTLKIDVDYNGDDTVDDTIFVFDHYNQNLGFRSVEKLYLDDGWDSDEIWNLVVGEDVGGIDTYNGTSGQDILMAGLTESTLNGGDGKDILIGDTNGYKTNFILGDGEEAWDNISDMIQNFGAEDTLDLSRLGIESVDELYIVDGSKLMTDRGSDEVQIAEFTNFQNELTIEEMLIQESTILYATIA